MKTKNKFTSILIVLLSMYTILSCSPEDGIDGEQGIPGTANVIYSEWFMPADYTSSTNFGIVNITYEKEAPQITQDVLDKSIILVFGRLEGYVPSFWPPNQVGQLPIVLTFIYYGQTMTDTWSAVANLGRITIKIVNDKNYYSTNPLSKKHQFRYVIIPGEQAAKSSLDYSKMTYQQICEKFNISQ